MDRKFESDIGMRVSEGNGRRSSNKVGVLCAAVISCALLVGSAAFLLPAMSSAEGGKVVSAVIYDAMDYLVYNEDNDCLIHYDDFNGIYDVKKSTNVKAMAYPPSVSAPGKYVKFTYTTTIHFDCLDSLDLNAEVAVADLEIPYVSSGIAPGLVPISWTMTMDGVSWDNTDVVLNGDGTVSEGASIPTPASSSYDTDKDILGASMVLPLLLESAWIDTGTEDVPVLTLLPAAYSVDVDVQIQVHIKVASPDSVEDYQVFLDDLEPAEDAFPEFSDYADLPEAVIIADSDSVPMGDVVNLDASTSENVDTYAWYLDDAPIGTEATLEYTFDDEMPGDYTFKLVVTSEAGLDDAAEVVVSVYDDTDPVAGIEIGTETPNDDGSVTVIFVSSSDDNVDVTSYVWYIVLLDDCKEWGDDSTMTYTFSAVGDYLVVLTVSDAAGNTDTANLTYSVSEPLEPEPTPDP